MKKTIKNVLTSTDVKPGNWVVMINHYSHKRDYFFVLKVFAPVIHGFFLEELLENPFRMLEESGTVVSVFSHPEKGQVKPPYLLQPTQKRVRIIKEKLRKQVEELTLLTNSTIGDMNPVRKYGVYFTDKSAFQKYDCITGCGAESTQEAVYENSKIRCCKKQACEKYAAKLAKK